MGCITFMSTQHDLFIKHVKWVGSCQLTSLTGWVRVKEPSHNYEMSRVWVETF